MVRMLGLLRSLSDSIVDGERVSETLHRSGND